MEETFCPGLRKRIKGTVALVGIGNPIRGDDGFGPKCIESLRGKVRAELFDCGTAPENYIIPILNANPQTVILLDAADFGAAPGTARVFEMKDVANVGFSTHNTSPVLLADLFRTGSSGIDIFMVVMQPRSTAFGDGLSEEVKHGIGHLEELFVSILP